MRLRVILRCPSSRPNQTRDKSRECKLFDEMELVKKLLSSFLTNSIEEFLHALIALVS
jgi:hypothetical protein